MASTLVLDRITVLPTGAFDQALNPPPVSGVRIEFAGFTETVDADNPTIIYRTGFNQGVNLDDIAVGPALTALNAFLADFSGNDDLIATLFPVVT